jgi:hypothetical protein
MRTRSVLQMVSSASVASMLGAVQHRPWYEANPSHCLNTFHFYNVITKEGLANH